MTHKTNHRGRAILLVLAVMALATAGLVYAHWTDTLQVNAQVNTGTAEITITPRSAANTDDDGTANGWEIPGDNGGGTEYDRWGLSSSNDPSTYSSPYWVGTRYTKDVARCRVMSTSDHTVTVLVDNAYPSYWCTMRFEQTVTGTIPLRSQVNRVTVCAADCGDPANWVLVPYVKGSDSFPYESGDGGDGELEMQINPPASCGYQYDPLFHFGSRLTFHVLQGAEQGATYQVRFDSEYWNYNEWSLANCVGFANFVDPPGTPAQPIP
jgi:hypothetical protein